MRHPAVALVGLALAAASAVGASVHLAKTDAAWTVPEYSSLTAVSAELNPVPRLSCGATSGLLLTGIPMNWTAPSISGNGLAPESYTISYAGTGGSGSMTSTTTSATIPGSAFTGNGTMTVIIYTKFGANWSSTASLQTRALVASGLGWTCS